MEGQKVIRQGYLDSSPGTKTDPNDPQAGWSKKFYVLFNCTPTNKARLDWFNDMNAFQTQPTIRKTIFVEEMKSIKASSTPGHQHAFQIETMRRVEPFLFSAASKSEKKDWVDCLNKLVTDIKKNKVADQAPKGGESHLGEGVYGNEIWGFEEKPSEFKIGVGDTISAKNLHLDKPNYNLQIYSHSLAISDPNTDGILYVWPYKLIRRYGRSRNSFTFEAGRRCASGEGVFILMTDEAENIFNSVQQFNDHQDGSSSSQPHIPNRNYTSHVSGPPAGGVPLPGIRERSLSGDGARPPPIPTTARPARNMQQPVPAPESPTVPPVLPYSSPQDTGDMYSSIYTDAPNTVTGTSGYGYAEPEPSQSSGMTSVIHHLQKTHLNQPSSDEYDEVSLNPLKKSSQKANDSEGAQYGQLYIQAKRNATTDRTDEDTYDEVGRH